MRYIISKFSKFSISGRYLLILLIPLISINLLAERTPPGTIILSKSVVKWKWDFETFLDSSAVTDTTRLIVQEFRNVILDVQAREHSLLPGDTAIFDILIQNDGNVSLEDFEIFETADFDTNYTPLDLSIGNFPVDSSITVEASMVVPYVEPGTVLYDSVAVHSTRFDKIWDYDSIVVGEWDYLTIMKEAEDDTIVTMSTINYFIIVENTGYKESENVTITDTVPEALHITDFGSSENFELDSYTNSVIVWKADQIEEGKVDTIGYSGNYLPIMCDSLAINTAHLNFRNIHAKSIDSVYVDCRPTIECSLWVDKDSAGPYDTLNYRIDIKSTSDFPIEDMTVFSVLPEYTENPQGSFDEILYEADMTKLLWRIDRLEPDQSINFDYSLTVTDEMNQGSYDLTDTMKVYYNKAGRHYLLCKKWVSTGLIMDFLFINKRCMSRIASTGDILIYIINIHNKSESSELFDVIIDDDLPFAFKYISNSAEILSSTGKEEIQVDDTSYASRLKYYIGHLDPETEVKLAYQLAVGAGADKGDGVNRAICYGYDNSDRVIYSNEAAEKVIVEGNIFGNEEFIIGKVFSDDDANGIQSDGERGLEKITLFTETGIRIVTGDEGKFSIPYIKPGKHVIRLDHETLPERSEPILTTAKSALDPYSQFVDVPACGFAKVTFAIKRGAAYAEKIPYHRAGINIELESTPSKKLFVKSDNPDGEYVLRTVYFDKGEYSLDGEAMRRLDDILKSIRRYVGVSLEVRGYTDLTPVRKGAEFKSNKELSQLRSSTVMSYLQKKGLPEHILRYTGLGEKRAKGQDRPEDRKVEVVAILENGLKPAKPVKNIDFITRLDIDANESIAELNTRYQFIGMDYVPGSAYFDGFRMVDDNHRNTEAAWELTELPGNLDKQIQLRGILYENGYYEIAPRILLTGDIRFVSGENLDFELSLPIQPEYQSASARLKMEDENYPPDKFRGFLSSSFAEAIDPGKMMQKDDVILYRIRANVSQDERKSTIEIKDKLPNELIYIENSAYRDGKNIYPEIKGNTLIWRFDILPGQRIIEFEYRTHVKSKYEISRIEELPVSHR